MQHIFANDFSPGVPSSKPPSDDGFEKKIREKLKAVNSKIAELRRQVGINDTLIRGLRENIELQKQEREEHGRLLTEVVLMEQFLDKAGLVLKEDEGELFLERKEATISVSSDEDVGSDVEDVPDDQMLLVKLRNTKEPGQQLVKFHPAISLKRNLERLGLGYAQLFMVSGVELDLRSVPDEAGVRSGMVLLGQ